MRCITLPGLLCGNDRRRVEFLSSPENNPDDSGELPPIFLDTDLSDRRQYGEVHMWTAPSSQGVLQCFDQIACAHMSGLLARSHMNAGQDGFRDRVPNSMAI
jgi:hypothetical protein